MLGKPLDKSMQMSDWEQRPLTDRQLTYAALDALCLLPAYQEMRRQLERLEAAGAPVASAMPSVDDGAARAAKAARPSAVGFIAAEVLEGLRFEIGMGRVGRGGGGLGKQSGFSGASIWSFDEGRMPPPAPAAGVVQATPAECRWSRPPPPPLARRQLLPLRPSRGLWQAPAIRALGLFRTFRGLL